MKTLSALLCALLAAVLAVGSAAAHVTVQPAQAVPNASQIFTVRVPTERDEPTVRVRVEFPAGLTVSRFQPKPGWTRTMDRDASGRITAVTWSGGRIEPAEFEDFIFQARTPEAAGKLAFRAIQTYASGETHEWVEAEGTGRPAAIVEVRAAAAGAAAATNEHGQPVAAAGAAGAAGATAAATAGGASAGAAATARPAATAGGAGITMGREDVPVSAGGSDLPLFVAIAAVALGLISVALSAVALSRARPAGQPA